MFRKILVANRGEIALRIIHAAKKLGIQTVAVYSTADAASPHLKHADAAVCIGPAPSAQSYLSMEAIVQSALQYNCQAIHPGYGFLSQNALFASLCEQYKITFIGPNPSSMRHMGDKARARKMMQNAGIEVVPGSSTIVANPEDAMAIARQLGFPVLLKATAGGGGRGMRLCRSEAELLQNFVQASLEAEKAFGNAALYLEKYIEKARHIELQVVADCFGNMIHLGERECSVQRRHQKLVEEAPSPGLSDKTRLEWGERALQALKKIGYQSAGTLEFVMDAQHKLYFIEMNTRIQVEHPVSEMITGVNIVEEQIKLAARQELSKKQADIPFSGHAIECRINAEDPANNFQPHPGQITRFRPPQTEGPGRIRIDTFVEEGCSIPPFYDSLICKLVAWGKSRPEAIATMQSALKNFVIEGVPTTIPFALKVMEDKKFQAGEYDTTIVEQIMERISHD